jgi:uncharacterized protein YecE (DUF72 family)
MANKSKPLIYVGTASWSDPGFVKDWYPKQLPAGERLAWYARHFSYVEVNSSFYGIPDFRTVERWTEQTPDDFLFDIKLHRLLSRHSTTEAHLSPELREVAQVKNGKVLLDPKLEKTVIRRILQVTHPLEVAGKLGAFLLQLSPSFGPRHEKLEELESLIKQFEGRTLAVELRNRSWLSEERKEQTFDFFREHKLTMVAVDAPESEHFMVMPFTDEVTNSQLAYLRLHGRNEEGYIKGRTVAERFNYQYSTTEIRQTVDQVASMAGKAKEVHVSYNNNASNYAPRAAAEFLEVARKEHPELELQGAPAPAEKKLKTGDLFSS